MSVLPGLRAAHAPDVEVRYGAAAVVAPGGIFSATISLVPDPGAPPESFCDRLVLPDGWVPLSPTGAPFSPARGGEIRLVAVPVPHSAPAGDYRIYYVLSLRDDALHELIRVPLTVTVPVVSELRIVAETAPESVLAGDSYAVVWRVINRGNHTASVRMRAKCSQGYAVSLTPPTLTLRPGGSALVWATAKTPGELRYEESNGMLLEAQVDGLGESGRQTAASYARIMPQFTTNPNPGDELSATLTNTSAYRSVEGRQSFGNQTQLAGGGFLDEDRTQQLQFLVLTAPTSNQTGLLAHDQYTLNYTSRTWDLMLGDNLYSLSPLTERWLFGRGIGVQYQQPSSAIGGYYAYTPWQSADVRQLGFFAQFAPWPAVSLRSNFLLEETPATEPWMDPRSFLPSLQLFLQPGKSATLELEGALSDNSELSTGGAYRARLKGDLGKTVFYDFERIYASPDYFGYYSDFASTSGTVSWRIDRDWTLRTSFEDAQSNLELDPRKGSALQVVDETVGIDRSITREFSVSLEPHYTSYTDHLPDGQPTFIQDTVALSGTWTTSVYTVRASVEDGGRQLDTSPRQNLGYESVSLLGIAQPNPNLTFSLLVSDGDSPYTAEPLREVVVNGAAQVNFGNGWRVRAIASATQSHDPPRLTQQATADVLLGYDFRNGTSVQVGVRDSATTGAGPDRGAYLSWSIPLPIQALRRQAYGSLEGVVRLRQGDDLKPLAGVILHMERLLAVTDHAGRFVFPLVKPGRHELTVDSGSLGPGIILSAPGPDTVELVRGKRALRQLEAVRASRIEGEVALFEAAPEAYEELAKGAPPGLRRSGVVGNVLIEVRQGDVVRRTESDERGYFAFDRLLPGEWTVTIDDHSLPERHRLERKEFVVQLAAGSVEHLEARALPIVHPIKIIGGGSLSIVSASSPP